MILIDVVIPILNEADNLEACLDSVKNLDIPENIQIKVNIVDGGSTDGSINIAKRYCDSNPIFQLINNPKKTAAAAMNIIIDKCFGDYVLRLDAGNTYDTSYLKLCYETSKKRNAANVGGIIETVAGSNQYGARLVQAIISHPFGVGNSVFRTGSSTEKKVDTVPFGFFKRSIFEKIGNYDENLIRAQDYELNQRIISAGYEIWLNPLIKAKYSTTTFWKFIYKNFTLEGPYNAYMWYKTPQSFSIRHSITLFFCLGIFGGIILSNFSNNIYNIFISIMILYAFLSSYFSIKLTIKHKEFMHLICLPFSFLIFHFFHGLGVLTGVLKIIMGISPVQKNPNN